MNDDKQLRFHNNFGDIHFARTYDIEHLEERWWVANYYDDRIATVTRAFGEDKLYVVQFDNGRDDIPSVWLNSESEAMKIALEFAINS